MTSAEKKFLSIGQEEIAFLQKLDDLAGRVVDNADYQPVADLTLVKDQALFDLLLGGVRRVAH